MTALTQGSRSALTSNVTRRHFLQGSAMAGFATFLAACGTSGTGGSAAPSAGASAGGGTGSTELRFANWIGYIDIADDGTYPTIKKFEAESGIKVKYLEDINANEEFYAASLAAPLDAGLPTEWDLVVLTDWMIGRLIRKGWLEAIDKANTPNFTANLAPTYVGRSFDPDTKFAAPWQSGMTGLAFDQKKTGPLTSLGVLYTDQFKGKVTYLGEMRDAVGLTALDQGADPATLTAAEFDAALAAMDTAIKAGIVRQVTGNSYVEMMASGDVVLAMGWSGDVLGLLVPDQTAEQDFQWVLAEEGGMLWTDNMAIPLGSPNKVAAEKWIDFYYDPVNAAAIEAYVNYVCPVVGAKEVMLELDPELANNPLIFPPADWIARLHQFRLTTAEEETAWDEAFTKMMGL
jgi:spermidine/putrescine transport system substrate-binding protein